MNIAALNNRRHVRVTKAPSSALEGVPPGDPVLINLSHGGACLWLSDPPQRGEGLALGFRIQGHERVLPSRLVWSRFCGAGSEDQIPSVADGWLAGFAFAEGDADTLIADVPHERLRAAEITVSVVAEDRAVGPLEKETEGDATTGLITFSEKSVAGAKAAAKELLPVLARHFTDVHIVFTRDRLEISAPFRTPAEMNPPEARRRDYRTIRENQVLEPAPAAPVTIEQPSAMVQPKSVSAMSRRRPVLIAGWSLAAAVLGGIFLGVFHRSEPVRAASNIPVEGQRVPAWAAGINQTALNGWIKIQKKFDLPDATVRSTVHVLRRDNEYSPGQDLYDLTRYPGQVNRAFSLLAKVEKGGSSNFSPLENDLKGRVVEGARFPDEPPGGPYSSLERESFNNVAVLAVIELLQRREDDPKVQALLAELEPNQTTVR